MSFVIAFLGLSFLIFIHELGHLIMAKLVGMRVEVFSIGFGKPIFSCTVANVKWQIGMLPFGGYVKIAGMEKEGQLEPHEIRDGFYGKSPWQRILVALAGPVVNIAFALIIFTAIYSFGGRMQNFGSHNTIIGAIDPKSEIVAQGLKAGDIVTQIDGKPIHSFQEFLYSAVMNQDSVQLNGSQVNYFTQEKKPFSVEAKLTKENIKAAKDLKTTGIKSFAHYLIYDPSAQPNHLLSISPLTQSGIEAQDRVVWVNGELIFSTAQLQDVMNNGKTLLTVKRANRYFLTRVPVLPINDLRLTADQKEELGDYKHAIQLPKALADYRFIPYDIDSKGYVQSSIIYIDEKAQQATVANRAFGSDTVLKKGDQIVAVAGQKVQSAVAIFNEIQLQKAAVIVQKGKWEPIATAEDFNAQFIKTYYSKELVSLIAEVGRRDGVVASGPYALLKPVQPVVYKELIPQLSDRMKMQAELEKKIASQEASADPEVKNLYTKQLKRFHQQLMLGAVFNDRQVYYNPNPLVQMRDVIAQTQQVLTALLTGQVSPKWLSGPVGIIQVVHSSYALGFKEVLFWLGVISLNLAIFNLLPIPVLDGGHIVMSLYEAATGTHISSRAKERIMIPFVILFIGFFIYVTFHDLSRLFHWFLK